MSDKIKLFGRSYNLFGNSDSDVIIKTKGLLKILYGNKYIDLIKDGKINVNSDFIFSVKSYDKIGVKNGMYICENDDSIYLRNGDNIIPIIGGNGNIYVSFLKELETTPDLKRLALINIGFLYDSLDSIDENSLQSGIIYVESTLKLYTVINGNISELTLDLPNPFTSLFVVAKTTNELGAIVIVGTGYNNSLLFDSMAIYSDEENSVLNSNLPILFSVNGKDIVTFSYELILSNIPITTLMLKSNGANSNVGFRLYIENGKSILEIDKVIARISDSSNIHLFPEYWLLKNNIITSASISDNILTISLNQENEFKVGDIVVFYIKTLKSLEDETSSEEIYETVDVYSRIECKVTESSNYSINVTCSEDLTSSNLDLLSGLFIYLIKSDSENPIRIQDNNIDIVEYDDEISDPVIKSRIGNIETLNLKTVESNSLKSITGHGCYSDNGVFKSAQYTNDVDLPSNDDSYKFASTHWVRQHSNTSSTLEITKGIIVLYEGDEVPNGWSKCDGENGTPNLQSITTDTSTFNYIIKL